MIGGQDPAPLGSDRSVERRIVTVLFADLVGFTPLSERLDPEDVATIQDAYFASVRETIGRYGGLIEKFIGDAAMAVFGAPRARDDDPERAVRAGFALLNGIENLGARLGLAPGELRLRVGINTGEVVYADAGPDQGRVTGDTDEQPPLVGGSRERPLARRRNGAAEGLGGQRFTARRGRPRRPHRACRRALGVEPGARAGRDRRGARAFLIGAVPGAGPGAPDAGSRPSTRSGLPKQNVAGSNSGKPPRWNEGGPTRSPRSRGAVPVPAAAS